MRLILAQAMTVRPTAMAVMKTAPVDTTVTKPAMPLPLRSTSINWLKGVIAALVVTAGVVYSVSAVATNYSVGVVTKGTFLLSEKANVQQGEKWVHGLVGYLPIGTRVYYVDDPVTLNNLEAGRPENYIPVFSSIGISGLLKEDRFQRVKDKRIAVVVNGTKKTWLHNPDPAKGEWKRLLSIGRYDGAYIEILGSRDKNFFDAVLHRTIKAGNLPMSEPVRLWKAYVDSGSVIIVDPQNFTEQTLPAPRWSPGRKLEKTFVQEMIDKVKDKLGDDIAKARQFLEDANSLQCLIGASAELQTGIKILGNGLSFKLDLAIKDQNHMFRVQQHELVIGDSKRSYVVLQSVKCEGLAAERLHRLTLQEGAYNTEKRDFVRLKDWQSKPSPYVISLGGREAPFRMIRIKDEPGYDTALSRLEDFVAGGESFIGKLPQNEKQILLNFILREISSFEHREIVDPSLVLQKRPGKGTALPLAQPLFREPMPTSISSRPEKPRLGG